MDKELLKKLQEHGYQPGFYNPWNYKLEAIPRGVKAKDVPYLEICLVRRWLEDKHGYIVHTGNPSEYYEVIIYHTSKPQTLETDEMYDSKDEAIKVGIELILERGELNV